VPKPAVIFSLKTLLICPNLHAGFGVCDFGQQISTNYKSLIPTTLANDQVQVQMIDIWQSQTKQTKTTLFLMPSTLILVLFWLSFKFDAQMMQAIKNKFVVFFFGRSKPVSIRVTMVTLFWVSLVLP